METFLLTLARFRALAPSMDMWVALTSDGRIAAELRSAGVPVTILGEARISRPLAVRRARRALASLLSTDRPDVVVCHQAWPLALFGPVVTRRSIALVLWMHMAASRRWLDRIAWRVRPGTVVCNSRFTASTLPKTRARIELVYAPVDVGASDAVRLKPDPASGSGFDLRRVRLQADRRPLVIVQVSRMEPLKGHRVLLDALGRLRDHSGWTCRLAGGAQRPHEARYMASLRTQAAALGIADRVEFLGDRSDVPSLLASADIYCQPNIKPDAFGLSVIEAMVAGLPVVTSSIGGAKEIVDETCGVLVAPRDAAALASQLSALLDNRAHRERLGSHGPERARGLCDPAVQMPRIAAILQRAADERSGAGHAGPASGARCRGGEAPGAQE
ncbi:MAG TPA: glycosyltransferase [Vicinamibacterales bacterium]|nr:glycosyltransferase [Vicinamibacterales bacterium]